MVREKRRMRASTVLAGLMLALAPGSAVLAEEAVAVARAEDPNAQEEKALPAPPAKVKVEGKLPYIPTSNSIITRFPQPLRLTPANVGTVSDPLLREQDAHVLGDALKNVSGVNVLTLSGVVDSFQLRGFDSVSSSMVMTDGAREPETAFYQMYNVERVEVFKGPGGFLYGADPIAGLVNIVRRQPVAGTFGSAGVSYGAFNTQNATVDYNKTTQGGDYSFRLNSAWWKSDGYRDDKESQGFGVNPAMTWRLGEKTSLNVNLEFLGSDYQPDGGLPLVGDRIADVPRTRSYQSPFDKSDQSIGRGQIDLETRLSDSWTLRNKLYYRGLDWDSDGTLLLGVGPGMTGSLEVFRALTQLDDRQRSLGNRLEGVLSAATGPVQHRLLLGVEGARHGDVFEFDVASLPNIDLEDPQETATHPLTPLPFQFLQGDARSLVVAPYVIDQVQFSEKWHGLAGARLDVIDFEETEAGTERRDADVSPLGGVLFAPNATLSLYANAGGSFSPPSSRVVGPRRPERSRQYEVGAKVDALASKLTFTVAAYRVDRENIAIPDDNGFTQQEGDQRSRGIELEVAAEPFSGFRTFLTYAYNDPELTRFAETVVVGLDPNFNPIFGTVDRSGNDPAFAPHHIANLWVSHRFDKGLGLAGGARYVSGQFIDEDNIASIDGYITLDAAVSYAIGKWDLHLKLNNLTDRDYETGAFPSNAVLPAPGFAAYGGVQRRF